jgi:hypothetical protein
VDAPDDRTNLEALAGRWARSRRSSAMCSLRSTWRGRGFDRRCCEDGAFRVWRRGAVCCGRGGRFAWRFSRLIPTLLEEYGK